MLITAGVSRMLITARVSRLLVTARVSRLLVTARVSRLLVTTRVSRLLVTAGVSRVLIILGVLTTALTAMTAISLTVSVTRRPILILGATCLIVAPGRYIGSGLSSVGWS